MYEYIYIVLHISPFGRTSQQIQAVDINGCRDSGWASKFFPGWTMLPTSRPSARAKVEIVSKYSNACVLYFYKVTVPYCICAMQVRVDP